MQNGTLILVFGIGAGLAVLIILWGVLKSMKKAGNHSGKADSTQAPIQTSNGALPQNTSNAAETAEFEEAEGEELIAVLTAAVAASLNTSTYNLRVRSFRHIREHLPVWNSASRIENIENSL